MLHNSGQCEKRLRTSLRIGSAHTTVQNELSILTKRLQPVLREVHHRAKISVRVGLCEFVDRLLGEMNDLRNHTNCPNERFRPFAGCMMAKFTFIAVLKLPPAGCQKSSL